MQVTTESLPYKSGRASCHHDCNGHRSDTLGAGGRIYLKKLTRRDFSFDLSPHLVICFCHPLKICKLNMKYPQILLRSVIAIFTSSMALARHSAEGGKMEPAYGSPEALAIDLEAESKSESDKDDSSNAPASVDDDSEKSTYSVNY